MAIHPGPTLKDDAMKDLSFDFQQTLDRDDDIDVFVDFKTTIQRHLEAPDVFSMRVEATLQAYKLDQEVTIGHLDAYRYSEQGLMSPYAASDYLEDVLWAIDPINADVARLAYMLRKSGPRYIRSQMKIDKSLVIESTLLLNTLSVNPIVQGYRFGLQMIRTLKDICAPSATLAALYAHPFLSEIELHPKVDQEAFRLNSIKALLSHYGSAKDLGFRKIAPTGQPGLMASIWNHTNPRPAQEFVPYLTLSAKDWCDLKATEDKTID